MREPKETWDRELDERCLAVVDDGWLNRERVQIVSYAACHLRDYRDALKAAELLRPEHRRSCPALVRRMGERARQAEAVSRVLLKVGLECLNDLRDFGLLERSLRVASAKL